jgi:hypothetical protein
MGEQILTKQMGLAIVPSCGLVTMAHHLKAVRALSTPAQMPHYQHGACKYRLMLGSHSKQVQSNNECLHIEAILGLWFILLDVCIRAYRAHSSPALPL